MLHLSLLIKFDSDMTLIKIFHVRVKSVPETVNSGSGCDNYWKLYLLTPKFNNILRWLLTLSGSFLPKPVTSTAKGNLRRPAYDRCWLPPTPLLLICQPVGQLNEAAIHAQLPSSRDQLIPQTADSSPQTHRPAYFAPCFQDFFLCVFTLFLSKCRSHPTARKELFPVWKLIRVLT